MERISSVSAFFPAYNDGGTIPSMVLAALIAMRQVTDDYEIIVVNDGSSDYTAQVLEELVSRYPELHVIHHPQNRGYGGALRTGFDGVLVSGCHPGDCHYLTGNYRARRRIAITKKFLEYMGMEPQRLQASWVSASEGGKFADVVSEVTRDLREIGPNRLFVDERDGTKTAE